MHARDHQARTRVRRPERPGILLKPAAAHGVTSIAPRPLERDSGDSLDLLRRWNIRERSMSGISFVHRLYPGEVQRRRAMDVILTDANLAAAGVRHVVARETFNESTAAPSSRPAVQQPSADASTKSDDLLSRVVKLVPGEVAAGYTALLAIVSSAGQGGTVKYAAPTAILLCSVLLVMLIRRAGQNHQPPVKPHPIQYVVSVAAFLAWAFSIRNPLEGFN